MPSRSPSTPNGCALLVVLAMVATVVSAPFVALAGVLKDMGVGRSTANSIAGISVIPTVIVLITIWAWRRSLRAERALRAAAVAAEQEAAAAAAEAARLERLSRSRGPKPAPTLIRSYRDAEVVAAAWMRWMGWGDAQPTATGPDGGLDVVGARAVGQVKAHVNPIGRPELQQLHGAALGKATVFFCLGGYTAQAVEWANGVGMALFRFDLAGEPEPINAEASRLMLHGAPGALRLVD